MAGECCAEAREVAELPEGSRGEEQEECCPEEAVERRIDAHGTPPKAWSELLLEFPQ
jgi:hypothetical protein